MKVGFCCSSWDLLHAGHILLLKEAKDNCDYLIIGIQSDPSIDRPQKNKPIESLQERILRVSSIKYVDNCFVYDTEADLYEYLLENEDGIDIRFLGSDYQDKKFTGSDLDIDLFYHIRDHNYSTSNLRQRIIDEYEDAKFAVVSDVINGMSRHQFY